MNSLQRRVPALRRHDHSTSTIRQHYYPEGGWGWVVCACAFLVHVLVTGLQLSFGVLLLHVVETWGKHSYLPAVWLGSLNLCVSLLVTPAVVGLCRRKSTRLAAVLGGLVTALACLFASFAQELHQVFLSYGLLLGVGMGVTRETSDLMIGQYFKRRRELVDMLVQSGAGIGLVLLSSVIQRYVSQLGWRLGLQVITVVVSSTFFIGTFYRSASLYHPQRRAILHLKTQKRKVKEKKEFKLKNPKPEEKPPYLDCSVLKARTVQVLVVSAALSGLGLYTPLLLLMAQCQQEGLEADSLSVLQTSLGLALVVGSLCCGFLVLRPTVQCWISRQYLCQATLFATGLSLLTLPAVRGYPGYLLFACTYGTALGGYRYTIKAYTLERVRARNFGRAWSLVQAAGAVSCLVGAPITEYINRACPKGGFYFSGVAVVFSACVFFVMNLRRRNFKKVETAISRAAEENQPCSVSVPRHLIAERELSRNGCSCAVLPPDGGTIALLRETRAPLLRHIGKSISFANSVDVLGEERMERVGDGLTCISEEGLLELAGHYSSVFPGDCITSCNKVESYLERQELVELSAGSDRPLQPRPLWTAVHRSQSEPDLSGYL